MIVVILIRKDKRLKSAKNHSKTHPTWLKNHVSNPSNLVYKGSQTILGRKRVCKEFAKFFKRVC